MKITFTFILTFVLSSAFAQEGMFWNNYTNINPAMSGLNYQQHGALSSSDYFEYGRPRNIHTNYNMRLGQKHGVGINYSRSSSFLNTSNIVANYNYQFDLKTAVNYLQVSG